MTSHEAVTSALEVRVDEIAAQLSDGAMAVAVYDYSTGLSWSRNGDRWFHAASVIKVAVLAALFDAVERGRFTLDSPLHVRNRFISAAGGRPFRIDANRDADRALHEAVGGVLPLSDLARHMIAASSNLATNLLLDLIGPDAARTALARRRIGGVDLVRGVEDDRAFEIGCINRITADGTIDLLRAVVEPREFSDASSRAMVDILAGQQLTGAIAPGLPTDARAVARVAHKTGEISTASHDAGIVFLPARAPYLVALLSEGGGSEDRLAVLTRASAVVYEALAAAGAPAWR